jgi:hypothetical protein
MFKTICIYSVHDSVPDSVHDVENHCLPDSVHDCVLDGAPYDVHGVLGCMYLSTCAR